jgi:hypothetical protein
MNVSSGYIFSRARFRSHTVSINQHNTNSPSSSTNNNNNRPAPFAAAVLLTLLSPLFIHNLRKTTTMTSLPDQMLDASAAACLVRIHSQPLTSDECNGASDALFDVYSKIDEPSVRFSNNIQRETFKPTMTNLAIPLSSTIDAGVLSELQCYIRAHCVEYFEATQADVSPGDPKNATKNQQQRGRRTPILIGRVGIRCVFCKHRSYNQRASQSTSFPSNLDKIYSGACYFTWRSR